MTKEQLAALPSGYYWLGKEGQLSRFPGKILTADSGESKYLLMFISDNNCIETLKDLPDGRAGSCYPLDEITGDIILDPIKLIKVDEPFQLTPETLATAEDGFYTHPDRVNENDPTMMIIFTDKAGVKQTTKPHKLDTQHGHFLAQGGNVQRVILT
jgi:hypothetical protein